MSVRQDIRKRLDQMARETSCPLAVLVGRHGEILERTITLRPEIEATLSPLPVEQIWRDHEPYEMARFVPGELMAHFPEATDGLVLQAITNFAIAALVNANTREAGLRELMRRLAWDIRAWAGRGPSGGSDEGGGGEEDVAFLSIKDIAKS